MLLVDVFKCILDGDDPLFELLINVGIGAQRLNEVRIISTGLVEYNEAAVSPK